MNAEIEGILGRKQRVMFACPKILDVLPFYQQLVDGGHEAIFLNAGQTESVIEAVVDFDPTVIVVYNPTDILPIVLAALLEIPIFYIQADNPENDKWKPVFQFSLNCSLVFHTRRSELGRHIHGAFADNLEQAYRMTVEHYGMLPLHRPVATEPYRPSSYLYDVIAIGNCSFITEKKLLDLCHEYILGPQKTECVVALKNRVMVDFDLYEVDLLEMLQAITEFDDNNPFYNHCLDLFSNFRRIHFFQRIAKLDDRYRVRLFGGDQLLKIIPADVYGGFLDKDSATVLSASKIVVNVSSNFFAPLPRIFNYSLYHALIVLNQYRVEKDIFIARGGFDLTLYHRLCSHLVMYKTMDECIDKIEMYLADETARQGKVDELNAFLMDETQVDIAGNFLLIGTDIIRQGYASDQRNWQDKHRDLLCANVEAIKCLTIVNELYSRQAIHPNQKKLAERSGQMIALFLNQVEETGDIAMADLARLERARYYRFLKRFDLALADLERIETPSGDVLVEQALNRRDRNEIDQAVILFETLLQGHPDHLQAKIHLAELYGNLSRFDEAIGLFKTVVERTPTYPHIHLLIAKLYLRKNEIDLAAYYFQLALDYNKHSFDIYLNLAKIEVTLRKYDLAIDHALSAYRLAEHDIIRQNKRDALLIIAAIVLETNRFGEHLQVILHGLSSLENHRVEYFLDLCLHLQFRAIPALLQRRLRSADISIFCQGLKEFPIISDDRRQKIVDELREFCLRMKLSRQIQQLEKAVLEHLGELMKR